MSSFTPRTSKSKTWLAIFGVVSVFLLIFMLSLAYALIFQPTRTSQIPATATRLPALSLPTALLPTNTPGPPLPQQVIFTVVEPIEGFSSCDSYGFRGFVMNGNNEPVPSVQVVVWDNQSGLVALNETTDDGFYSIELQELPAHQRLWVQLIENDLPVSQPLLVEPNVDCQTGYQIYEIDWRWVADQ